ncbi:hypothetical protein CCM_09245 [Cordyceps militaris CM01]|uniref:Uncharacterized protein n=1 Tax=Cordyceps militaris (strain CM01) TaxID=983644 RepID=G3JTV5_CORMM|nr:uncharacterized protein CCM_09245 [Cordyceps militaris CM01]EGX88109.1 hypothetical protein CCM_09245 [Cordyceps militaris CM01]
MYSAISTVDGSLPNSIPAKNKLQRPGIASEQYQFHDEPPDADFADDAPTEPAASLARRAATPPGPYKPVKLVQWGIYWLTIVQMISFFAAGVAFSVGHHLFYNSLNGTEVTATKNGTSRWDLQRQEWKIRVGTGFAFIAKTCLASAIVVAYKQRVWTSCRQRAYSIAGLDALFSAPTDLLAFINSELLCCKLATVLAALVWLLPLSALITPATLTIVPSRQRKEAISSTYKDLHGGRFKHEHPAHARTSPKLVMDGALHRTIPAVSRTTARTTRNSRCGDLRWFSLFGAKGGADDFARDCVLGGAVCSDDPRGRSRPLVMRLREKSYACLLRNTSYSARFHSSLLQTTVELIAHKWQDMDTSYDPTYGVVGKAIAKMLTGAYYFSLELKGEGKDVIMRLGSARTSIDSTALMGALEDRVNNAYYKEIFKTSPKDAALTSNSSLGDLVEELSRNITLSLFSSTRLWANKTDWYDTMVTFDRSINIYRYNAQNLWIAYGVAIGVTLVSIGVGFLALFSNGVSHGINSSNILATTRNSSLDELFVGSSLGALPVSKDVLDAKIMFGVFEEDGNDGDGDHQVAGRVGFGLESQVKNIERGAECY